MSSSDFPPGVDPRIAPPGTPPPAAFDADLRPQVAARGAAGAPWLIGGGSVLIGLFAFLWLSAHRTPPSHDLPSAAATTQAPEIIAPPPPPEVDAMQSAARGVVPPPAVALVTPPPVTTPVIAPAVAPPAPVAAPPARAPVLVVDMAGPGEAQSAAQAATPGAAKPADAGAGHSGAAGGLNSDEQFAARVESGPEPEHARATMLRNQSTTAPQGTIIPAVLETALNSDLPGFARAVVSRDVRSFDGSRVLIPRGSRVIGEYRSAVALGQSRIFVIWTRVLRPDGGSIQISSGGGDDLGRAGLAGKVDRHFLERFSGAALMTVLGAASYALAGTPSTQVVIGSSSGSNLTGAAGGFAPADIPPTIKVAQGAPIRIFVQRDLDFTPVGGVAP